MGKETSDHKKTSFSVSERETESHEQVWAPVVEECLEMSHSSFGHWKRSLGKGCLNKSVNNKQRLFSHVRFLTERRHTISRNDAACETDNNTLGTSYSCLIPNSKSPVIIEDITTPPGGKEEVTPILFSADEFFRFLCSCDFHGCKMLRVVGGPLLQRLLTALYVLEVKGSIRLHHSRVFMNSERRAAQHTVIEGAHDDIEQDQGLPGWVKEVILVNMVHYSIASIPSYHQEESDENKAPLDTSTKDLSSILADRIPTAHRLYPVERLKMAPKLCHDPKVRINEVENEIEALKEMKEKEAIEAAAGKGKNGKEAVKGKNPEDSKEKQDKGGGGEVEDIAEDPYLVLEGSHTLNEVGTTDIPKEKVMKNITNEVPFGDENAPNKESSDTSVQISTEMPDKENAVASNPDVNDINKSETVVDDVVQAGQSDRSFTQCKKGPSGTSTQSLGENVSVEVSEKWELLQLPENDMYVTGLYSGRPKNMQAASTRMHQANKVKLKQRSEATKSHDKASKDDRSIDLISRFKCLAVAKEANRRKAMAPKVEIHKGINGERIVKDQWRKYSNEQEEMEMRVATFSEFQAGVLKRLAEYPIPRSEVKTIDTRNKSLNNVNKNCTSRTRKESKPSKPEVKDWNKSQRVKTDNSWFDPQSGEKKYCQKVRFLDQHLDATKNVRGNHGLDARGSILANSIAQRRILPPLGPLKSIKDDAVIEKTKNKEAEKRNGTKVVSAKPFSSPISVSRPKASTTHGSHIANKAPLTMLEICNAKHSESPSRQCNFRGNMNMNKVEKQILIGSKNNNSDSSLQGVGSNTSAAPLRSSTKSDRSDVSRRSMESIGEEKSSDEPQKTVVKRNTSVPRKPTKSEILQRDLSRYTCSCKCKCYECDDEENILDGMRPQCLDLPFTYPVKLGNLKRSFRYLCKQDKHCVAVEDISATTCLDDRGDEWFLALIMAALDTIVIRKDILASSFGQTYTSIVFSKSGAI